jgi:hypothetical protein
MGGTRMTLAIVAVVAATVGAGTADAHNSTDHDHVPTTMRRSDRIVAQRATAADQDVEVAAADGYASTLDTLGCFQDPQGGMGLHYINTALLDDTVDLTKPEALVYELRADASIAGLVAHEYIVPVDAWTSTRPPTLGGVPLHRHPTLPLWVLHTWLWKDNPAGDFADWNPAVRPCPDGVPVFDHDRPATAQANTTPSSGPSNVGIATDRDGHLPPMRA